MFLDVFRFSYFWVYVLVGFLGVFLFNFLWELGNNIKFCFQGICVKFQNLELVEVQEGGRVCFIWGNRELDLSEVQE